eukprot:10362055-Alexandrium_andersonii.AAC.1
MSTGGLGAGAAGACNGAGAVGACAIAGAWYAGGGWAGAVGIGAAMTCVPAAAPAGGRCCHGRL